MDTGNRNQFDFQDEIRKKNFEIEQLHKCLSGRPGIVESSLDAEAKDALISILSTNFEPTPRQSLLVIASLFPERISVVDNVFQKASQSDNFNLKREFLSLLLLFATEYWQALHDGKSDFEAKKCLGKKYAPNEGVSTNKPKTQETRTFIYKGEPIKMMRHLKIGNKPSIAETIRVHFEWVNDEQKLVIGYVGPHLDQN